MRSITLGQPSDYRNYLTNLAKNNNAAYTRRLEDQSVFATHMRLGEAAKGDILGAMKLVLEKGSALVLGAGPLIDVPIAELVRQFPRVVLADLDPETVAQALMGRDIEDHLLRHVEVWNTNLSGISASYLDSMVSAARLGDEGEFYDFLINPQRDPEIVRDHFDLLLSSVANNVVDWTYAYVVRQIQADSSFNARRFASFLLGHQDRDLFRVGLFDAHLAQTRKMLARGGIFYLDLAIRSSSSSGDYFFLSREMIEETIQKYFRPHNTLEPYNIRKHKGEESELELMTFVLQDRGY